ncbi:MAG: 7-cyano-7-deazaguanine synthase [archaeon]|nr:7-cyano-7-deazaguanine synthase [archaeon]
MNKAIILCSGGLDSVTTAHSVSKEQKYKSIILLFFNYGQRTLEDERKCARNCALELDAEFIEVKLDFLKDISASLINSNNLPNKITISKLKETSGESQQWYVPCRNQIFLSYALALAESIFIKDKKKSDIFVGFKCEGNDCYPDTTKDFINLINNLSNSSTIGKFKVFSPLIEKDKEDIIKFGEKLGIDFTKTFSCYTGKEIHCGCCLSCRLRQEGFYWANIKDPTKYRVEMKDFRRAAD